MKTILATLLLGGALVGCSGGDSSPAGPEANSGKTYTKADADAAQPVRGGADDSK
jgi:hypothetical protein